MSPALNERVSAFIQASLSLPARSGKGAETANEAQAAAHRGLMMCDRLSVKNLLVFASHCDRTARLRPAEGIEDCGGAGPMEAALEQLLSLANARIVSAGELVKLFQLLQPFTAANDRIARALWLWRMVRGSDADRRFLQTCEPADAWNTPEKGQTFRRVA